MFTATQPIRDIVAELSSASEILARFEINSSEDGDMNLEEACGASQLSVDQVLEKLEDAAVHEGAAGLDPTQFTLTRLIQYIVRVHHRYLRVQLPQLVGLARRVAKKCSAQSEAWRRISILLEELRTTMSAHFEKEEQVLFPYVAQLEDDPRLACIPADSNFGSMTETVFLMAQEHEGVEHILREIEVLLSRIGPTAWDNEAQWDFISAMRALKNDIEVHVQLEDYCLFPRAIQAEPAPGNGR
jgi:regulator of cell morphogenesis and NO signaling